MDTLTLRPSETGALAFSAWQPRAAPFSSRTVVSQLAVRPRSPEGAASRVFGSSTVVGALAAVAVAASRSRRGRGNRSFARAAEGSGRVLRVENNGEVAVRLTGVATELDRFMSENAVDIVLQNMRKIEDKPGAVGTKYCYFDPFFAGTATIQMRLTVCVEVPQSGCCNVKIMNMEAAPVDKDTGEAIFPEKAETPFVFNTENKLTWVPEGPELNVKNMVRGYSEVSLPWWFPIPDSILKAGISSALDRLISSGQKKVMAKLSERFSEWRAERSLVSQP